MNDLSFLARRADPSRTDPSQGADSDRTRRVLTREEAIALAESARQMTSIPVDWIIIVQRAAAVAKIVNSQRFHCIDLDELRLEFNTKLGSGFGVLVGTNVRDAATLRRAIHSAETAKAPQMRVEDQEPDDADDPHHQWTKPKHYLPISLWHDSTARAMETARGETLAHMASCMQTLQTLGESNTSSLPPLTMAATVAVSARVRLCHYAGGMNAWGEATDSEVTANARTLDGKASGWSGQTHRDWGQIDPERIVREAVTMANRTRGAVRLEPGRYTAVLGPAAVGQLVRMMYGYFAVFRNRDMLGPFSLVNAPDGKKLRLGQRVFDERISMWSEPNDPMGGYFPFFPDGWPSDKALWIEHGVLRNLAYNEEEALHIGRPATLEPWSMHMGGGTTTIDEMIRNCDRGVYVHRFGSVQYANPRLCGLSGTTRDGCFLIKDGKIAHPITNFRFFESPFLMFNRILAIGVPERVAFGYLRPQWSMTLTSPEEHQWPAPPIIVPPLMIRDFNFSSLSDAV